MLIQPKIRGPICTTAHPIGCEATVKHEIDYVEAEGLFTGPKNVLIIGASTGYGLASRIVATFGSKAKTIGVFFEKEADDKRTASPGWYNTAAFERLAHEHHYYAKSINGDAFSDAVKEETERLIAADFKQVDLVIYSLASPRRLHPVTGELHSSVLKPTHQTYRSKTVDVFRGEVKEIDIEPANQAEIDHTIAVMGGEDWAMWIDKLLKNNLLAKGALTVAYSYIGPELTHPIYKNGTIGHAKTHLKKTADLLNQQLHALGGRALVSVNKAVVTQASAAIPVVPLYIALLFKLMKANHTHEGCIEQIYRLFKDYLYAASFATDEEGYIRLDDWEMNPDIQQQIVAMWPSITTENLSQLTDIEGYREEFYRLFGFSWPDVNYDQEVNPKVNIDSLISVD